jgi:hypothetical protein
MLTYKVYGKNGAECVTGRCALEVAEYWNSGHEVVQIEKHMENLIRQIPDTTPKEFILKPWFEMDDIFHSNSLVFPLELTFEHKDPSNSIVTKFDPVFDYGENGQIIFENNQFFFKDYFSGKDLNLEKHTLFHGQSFSKGFFTSDNELSVEEEFCPQLLNFVVTQHDDILLLLEMYYGDDRVINLAPNIDCGTTTQNEVFWFD